MSIIHYRLIAAIVFGLLAGLVNFNLLRKSSGSANVGAEKFVQLSKNVELGEHFTSEVLLQFTVPESIMRLGNGWSFAAVRWSDRAILVDRPANRSMTAGDIVFHQDVQPPKDRLDLRADEVAIHVPVSGVVFQPELISVGDSVGFAVADEDAGLRNIKSNTGGLLPKPGPFNQPALPDQLGVDLTTHPESGEVLGPFRLVAIGPRSDPLARDRSINANVIAVAGKLDASNHLDAASRHLLAMTGKSASKLRVVLYQASDARSSDH